MKRLFYGFFILITAVVGILLALAITNSESPVPLVFATREPQAPLVVATSETQYPLPTITAESQDPLVVLEKNMAKYSANSTAMWVPPPKTMRDLLKKTDVIVIGTVGSVVNSSTMGSYNEADNLRIQQTGDPVPKLPITDYEIQVETTILDDGVLSSGRPLILRMIGRQGVEQRFPSILQMLQPGDRRLFTLSVNPDGATYGLYGWWSHFIIAGDKVTYSDDLRTPIGFTDKVRPEDFIKELESIVGRN